MATLAAGRLVTDAAACSVDEGDAQMLLTHARGCACYRGAANAIEPTRRSPITGERAGIWAERLVAR
jgi:hypothetical protein